MTTESKEGESEIGGLPPVMTEAEREAYVRTLSRAPSNYELHVDEGAYVLKDEATVGAMHGLRARIVGDAALRHLGPRPLGVLLLELGAALLARTMTRETFESNARLWYDSVKLDDDGSATANARGGEA